MVVGNGGTIEHESPKDGVPRRRVRVGRIAVLLAAVAVLLALVTGTSGAVKTNKAAKGKTVTFALPPGFNPNYIVPIEPDSANSVQQFNFFQFLLYRPLYWEGNGASTAIDQARSLAQLPVYTDGGRTVTIHLKHYVWSNGKPLTSRDLEFFMNLLRANEKVWGSYNAGEFPENVTSWSEPNASTFVLHLNARYNETWFTNDQLFFIQPMPQAAWDKTSASSPVGNYDLTTAGAKKVYAFLNKQADTLTTYATNPLWKVVDGPWKISSYSSTGPVTFVRNDRYSGPATGNVTKLVTLPFTSGSAEENEVRTGAIDYGYVQPQDTSVQSALRSSGYAIVPWAPYQYSYIIPNLNTNNEATRSELRQLYIRQALEHLIDEKAIIKDFFHGFALPSYGPVPVNSPYADKTDKDGVYPYSPSAARTLLKDHGWSVSSSGTKCTRPGSGSSDCGVGIPSGATIRLHLTYYSGTVAVQLQDELIASDASRVGISISLSSEPLGAVFSAISQCKPNSSACSWVMGEYGGWTPFAYPIDPGLFGISSAFDAMSYNNPTNNKNMRAVIYSGSPNAERAYENFIAKDLPVLFVPSPDTQLSAITRKLKDVGTQEPTLGITPEDWVLR